MTPDEFREKLLSLPPEDVVERYIITEDPGPFTSHDALLEFKDRIRAKFDLSDEHSLSAIVVGSAKLGFAILEKPARNGKSYKPAYRAYRAGNSDIDVAIVSPALYGKLWHDLAQFGASQHAFPWRSDLSAYMLHGWIRPDKFPFAAPQRCSDWKELVNAVSRSKHFRYKRLRCGIYHSQYFLKIYQQRGVIAAQQAERAS